VPRALLDEVQAKQALWQEFRDHDASLNVTLHGDRSFQLFEVRIFS
jgi:hypothetical protein